MSSPPSIFFPIPTNLSFFLTHKTIFLLPFFFLFSNLFLSFLTYFFLPLSFSFLFPFPCSQAKIALFLRNFELPPRFSSELYAKFHPGTSEGGFRWYQRTRAPGSLGRRFLNFFFIFEGVGGAIYPRR